MPWGVERGERAGEAAGTMWSLGRFFAATPAGAGAGPAFFAVYMVFAEASAGGGPGRLGADGDRGAAPVDVVAGVDAAAVFFAGLVFGDGFAGVFVFVFVFVRTPEPAALSAGFCFGFVAEPESLADFTGEVLVLAPVTPLIESDDRVRAKRAGLGGAEELAFVGVARPLNAADAAAWAELMKTKEKKEGDVRGKKRGGAGMGAGGRCWLRAGVEGRNKARKKNAPQLGPSARILAPGARRKCFRRGRKGGCGCCGAPNRLDANVLFEHVLK